MGSRTATPVLDLHVNTTNTPALRMEQNNGGGFTAQTWDIAGNEANFFVRDVTGGSRLPFRLRPAGAGIIPAFLLLVMIAGIGVLASTLWPWVRPVELAAEDLTEVYRPPLVVDGRSWAGARGTWNGIGSGPVSAAAVTRTCRHIQPQAAQFRPQRVGRRQQLCR